MKFTYKNHNGKLTFYPFSIPSSRTYPFFPLIQLWKITPFFYNKFFGFGGGGRGEASPLPPAGAHVFVGEAWFDTDITHKYVMKSNLCKSQAAECLLHYLVRNNYKYNFTLHAHRDPKFSDYNNTGKNVWELRDEILQIRKLSLF